MLLHSSDFVHQFSVWSHHCYVQTQPFFLKKPFSSCFNIKNDSLLQTSKLKYYWSVVLVVFYWDLWGQRTSQPTSSNNVNNHKYFQQMV